MWHRPEWPNRGSRVILELGYLNCTGQVVMTVLPKNLLELKSRDIGEKGNIAKLWDIMWNCYLGSVADKCMNDFIYGYMSLTCYLITMVMGPKTPLGQVDEWP